MQSAELVVSLRQEVAEGKDTLDKQIKETAQQMAVEAAEVQNLNEMIKALKGQNDEVHSACSLSSPYMIARYIPFCALTRCCAWPECGVSG